MKARGIDILGDYHQTYEMYLQQIWWIEMTAVDVHRECTLELSRSVFITMLLILTLWLTYLSTCINHAVIKRQIENDKNALLPTDIFVFLVVFL